MHELYNLKEMLCKELKEFGRKDSLSLSSLDVIDKLSHAIKNIDKVIMAHEEEEYSQSMDGSYADGNSYDSYNSGSYYVRPDGSYSRDSSYARGRRGNVRRDSMGRYSRSGSDIASQLREVMHDLPDEKTKAEMRKFIEKMDNMQ